MFPGLPAAPSVQQGWGPEISTGADDPGRPATLEQGAGMQQAASTATSTNSAAAAKPAGQPPRSAPAPRGLQGSPCGRLHHIQTRVTRGAEGPVPGCRPWTWSPQEQGGVRGPGRGLPHPASCEGRTDTDRAGPTPRRLRHQLPRRGQEQGWAGAWCRLRPRGGDSLGWWRNPGPRGLRPARSLCAEPAPGVEPSIGARSPGLTSSL